MTTRRALVLAILLACACSKKPDPARSDHPPEPPPLPSHFSPNAKTAKFTILATRTEKTWSFIDAELAGGGRFSFGYDTSKSTDAKLSVPSAEEGGKVVVTLAKAFGDTAPDPLAPQPLVFPPVTASDVRDDAIGWSAKLTLVQKRLSAKIAITLGTQRKQGAFVEEPGQHSEDLSLVLARQLRDGPRPRRTEETDAHVWELGPRLGPWRILSGRGARFLDFASQDRRVVFSVPTSDGATAALSMSSAGNGTPIEVARTKNVLVRFVCATASETCILAEQTDVFVVDPKPKPLHLLATKATLAATPLPPDGSFVAFYSWPTIAGKDASELIFEPTAGGKPTQLVVDEPRLDVVGWQGSGSGLRAIARRSSSKEQAKSPCWLAIDPRTGAKTPLDLGAGVPSPDGARVAKLALPELVVTGRGLEEPLRLDLHPDDRDQLRELPSWVTHRYLRFDTERRGFFDVERSKINYALRSDEDDLKTIVYSPRLEWAVGSDESSLHIASVIVR